MENFPPTCPDDIPRMLKRFSWRSSCLGFSGPNIFQKAGCSLNVARSSCWTELELISALPLPVAVHDRFLSAVRSHRLVDCRDLRSTLTNNALAHTYLGLSISEKVWHEGNQNMVTTHHS